MSIRASWFCNESDTKQVPPSLLMDAKGQLFDGADEFFVTYTPRTYPYDAMCTHLLEPQYLYTSVDSISHNMIVSFSDGAQFVPVYDDMTIAAQEPRVTFLFTVPASGSVWGVRPDMYAAISCGVKHVKEDIWRVWPLSFRHCEARMFPSLLFWDDENRQLLHYTDDIQLSLCRQQISMGTGKKRRRIQLPYSIRRYMLTFCDMQVWTYPHLVYWADGNSEFANNAVVSMQFSS